MKNEKKRKQEEDQYYFQGYFKWYWGKHGFFSAMWAFYGVGFINKMICSVFTSFGLAIGAFLTKKLLVIPFGYGRFC